MKTNFTPVSGLTNPVLVKAEQGIEAQLTPDNRANYMKIVVAGMRAGLSKGPNGMMGKLRTSKDPIASCAEGAVALAFILRHQSQGIMPLKAMIPAAMTLMLHALGFVDRTGIASIGPDDLVRATNLFNKTLLTAFKITPQMLGNAMNKVHALTQDPIAVEQMKRKAGTSVHPDAQAMPTPVPGAS